MHRLTLSVLCLVFLAACQPATTELTEEQKAEIVGELRALVEGSKAAIVALDPDRLLRDYEDSEEFTFTIYGDVHRSFSDWSDLVRSAFAQMGSMEGCEHSDEAIQVLALDIAVVTGDLTCSGTASAGGPFLIDHTFTAVLVKRNDQWKIVNLSETYPQAETSSEEA